MVFQIEATSEHDPGVPTASCRVATGKDVNYFFFITIINVYSVFRFSRHLEISSQKYLHIYVNNYPQKESSNNSNPFFFLFFFTLKQTKTKELFRMFHFFSGGQ